jgi:hypothetical protein
MSQDDTLRQRLRQYLDNIEEVKEGKDWLRDLVEWLVQELLEVEFSEFMVAEPYERSGEPQGYRNGYRQGDLFTRVGRLTLRVPRDREGRFSTQLFEHYHRSEKALVLALQESYLQGVSTRKMRRITEKLCGVESVKIKPVPAQGFPVWLKRWTKSYLAGDSDKLSQSDKRASENCRPASFDSQSASADAISARSPP